MCNVEDVNRRDDEVKIEGPWVLIEATMVDVKERKIIKKKRHGMDETWTKGKRDPLITFSTNCRESRNYDGQCDERTQAPFFIDKSPRHLPTKTYWSSRIFGFSI